ncbi:MAG: LCP family protein [Firmicutes bacterium]|nr:LCP family protein [Bacillota bacterium]
MARTRKKKASIPGIIFFVLQIVISVVFVVLLSGLNLLPTRYVIIIGAVLLALAVLALIMQISRSGKAVGAIYSAVILVVLSIGSVYLWRTNTAIDQVVTDDRSVTSRITVLTKADSPMEGLQDLAGHVLGTQSSLDQAKMNQTLTELQIHFEDPLQTSDYISYNAAVQGLYNGEVDAILFNEAFRGIITDTYPDFETETKTLSEYTYKEVVRTQETSKPEDSSNSGQTEEAKPKIEAPEEVFTVYISGNDSFGAVTTESGRSDVNILMTINTKTKQILLTTTPRDAYIQLPWGSYDKLTHAGIYGIDCSEETLSAVYGIPIDYYVRINFEGFQNIVDALGGVEVYSDIAFTSWDGHWYDEGYNYLDGESALSFVRERHSLAGGDFARGRNQMRMIQAVMDKATSPAILSNYLQLMDSLSYCFATDMPKDEISKLVKMQLDDNAEWNIVSYEVNGWGNMRDTCYSAYGEALSVVDLDPDSVNEAINKMHALIDGEILYQETAE